MRHTTILTVTNDAGWLAEVRPVLHAMGRGRLVVARSVEEAAALLDVAGARLVVVHGGESGPSREQLAGLLWANSIQERPAAVAVVDDEYDAERATSLFQLGVDEYLALDEHADRAEAVLLDLAQSRPAPRAVVGVAASGSKSLKTRTAAGSTPDHAAVA